MHELTFLRGGGGSKAEKDSRVLRKLTISKESKFFFVCCLLEPNWRWEMWFKCCWTFSSYIQKVERLTKFFFFFLIVGTSSGVHLFNHLLWSIFQPSITRYCKQFLQVLACFMVTSCGQLSCTASTPVFLTCGLPSCIPCRLCSCHISPLLGFEPGTSPVPCYQLSYPGLDLDWQSTQIFFEASTVKTLSKRRYYLKYKCRDF